MRIIIRSVKITAVISVVFVIMFSHIRQYTEENNKSYAKKSEYIFLYSGEGRSGPMQLQIKTDNLHNIKDVKVISHEETKEYVIDKASIHITGKRSRRKQEYKK